MFSITLSWREYIYIYLIVNHAGRHCCLWCHIESSELALDPSARGPVVPRTMTSLKSDLESFQRDGSNIKRAKFYNNVIREPFFPITLQKAC